MAKTKASQNVDYQAERSENFLGPFNRYVKNKPWQLKVKYNYYKLPEDEEEVEKEKEEDDDGGLNTQSTMKTMTSNAFGEDLGAS